jgi:hypothetical protein
VATHTFRSRVGLNSGTESLPSDRRMNCSHGVCSWRTANGFSRCTVAQKLEPRSHVIAIRSV